MKDGRSKTSAANGRLSGGRPTIDDTVFTRFGVDRPLSVLFDAIAERYGNAEATALRAIYDEADRRYQRAHRLLGFERDVKRGPGLLMSGEKLARRERALREPQAYIDGLFDE